MEVRVYLPHFTQKQARFDETIEVKSHAVAEFIKERKDWQHVISNDVEVSFDSKRPLIKLSGESSLIVQSAMTFFKTLAESLYTGTLVIAKAGARDYFNEQGKTILSRLVRENTFAVVLQEDDMLEEEKYDFSQGSLGGVFNSCSKVYALQVGLLTLEVSLGDITKEKTDAIVNSSNKKFSLKSGVSKAILDAAGEEVEQELLQMARDTHFQLKEIVTSSGNLPCKEIIHIVGCCVPADIKQNVLRVLELCENHKFNSVAFPALGTGLGGAIPAKVADAMISAVVDFASKNEPVHVKSVKILIFHKNMLPDFHQNMNKRAIKTKKSTFVRNKGKKAILFEEIEPVVFQLCGKKPEDLSKASAMINSLLNQKQMEITICDPAISHFTKDELEMLSKMERELKVSVKTEQKGQDSWNGLAGFINTAESCTRDMIRKVERNEIQALALLTSSKVEWQYKSGHKFEPFDVHTNCDLEDALNFQKSSVKVNIKGKEYEVDIHRKVATKRRKQIELRRVQKDADQSSLPSTWEDMEGQTVVLVKLATGLQEFADVEKEFRKTGISCKIIKIERVQNSTLWKTYVIKKEELDNKNKHTNNEKCLFHGTHSDNTDQINLYGFNRSYAGKHGASYGNGSYFAVDPCYSAKYYSKSDAKGHKCMYFTRVLVGDFTQGKKGLLTPPKKNFNGVHLYDSVTDKMNNPSMFVIFNDMQAYPEYLITFCNK